MQSAKRTTPSFLHREFVGRFPVVKTTFSFLAVLFVFIGRMPFVFIVRMPFPPLTVDNAYPLFALLITPGFYLNDVEVADKDPAYDSLSRYNQHYIQQEV